MASDRSYEYNRLAVSLVFIVPALADLLYGYDCGAISYAILQMQDEDLSGISWGHILTIRPALQGAVISFAALGAFVASVFIYSVDASRIRELQIGALLYIAGALLQVSSSLPLSMHTAISLLMVGRFVYGLGIGVSMHAAPTYLGEMTPSSIRGLILSLKEAANTLGVLIGYQIGYTYSQKQGGWVFSFLMTTIFAAMSLILSCFLPKSARWLLLHDKNREAKNSLRFVYADEAAVEATSTAIRNHLLQRRIDKTTHTLLWDQTNRRALIIGVGIIALQQLTGSPAMLAYASAVFEESGSASSSSVQMAMFQLFVTLIAAALVEWSGRKVILYVGCTSMAVSLVALVICFGHYDNFVKIAMFVYIGGFQAGFGKSTQN